MAVGEVKLDRRAALLPLLVVLAGCAAALYLAREQDRSNQAFATEQLRQRAEGLADAIVGRIDRYQYGLRGARGAVLIAGENGLTRQQFRQYAESRQIEREFPGARGFGYIRRVPVADEAAFLARARADGKPDFNIRMLTPHADERYVIQYIEPVERNGPAVGLDVASEANRRWAADTSIGRDEATITAPITLVQATGQKLRSFLLMLPVYRPGMTTASEAERRAAAHGWAYAPIVMDEVLAGVAPDPAQLSIELADVSDDAAGDTFFRSGGSSPAKSVPYIEPVVTQRVVLGRKWKLVVVPSQAYVASLRLTSPTLVGVSGIVSSLVAAALMMLVAVGRARRRQVIESQASTATIVDNASDAIIGQALDGTVTHWNPAAARLFGIQAAEALGRPLIELIVPPERHPEDADLRRRAASGGDIAPFDTVRLRRDGQTVEVAVTPALMKNADGRVVGVAKLMRDITDIKRYERELVSVNADLDRTVQQRTTELTASRERLSDALRENEALLHTIKEQAIYSVADVHGTIIDINERFCEISGYSRDELIGQNHRIIQSGTHDAAFWREMWRTIASGRSFRGEVCNRAKDGSLYWVDSIIAPFLGADGKPERYVSIRHDITAEKRAKAQIEAQRERLDNILRGTNVGTWEWNVQTGETVFNERWAEIVGRRLEDLGSINIQTWLDLAHPEDLARSGDLLQAHFEGRSPAYECEARMRHADGRWIWVLDRGRVLSWTADGKPEWMFGTHMDITERKATEQRLRDSEAFLARVGEVSGVGGWSYEIATQTLVWNRETRRIVEADDDYQPTLPAAIELYPVEVRDFVQRSVQRAADEGEPFDIEVPFITMKQNRRWVRALGVAEYQPGLPRGQGPERLVGAFQDITERHEAAQALLEAKSAAESASAAKSAFLANMSHEIRTPLNAIVGVAHLLEGTTLDADQRQLVGKTQLAARSLLGIVNDVLDLAKIEAGELTLDEIDFQPSELVHEVASIYEPQAVEKGLQLHVRVADELPPWLHGDQGRLRQMIVNLLSNAIKFTARGDVELGIGVQRAQSQRVLLRITVRDTGVGIDAVTQERLFLPFVQADATTTRRFGGSGLGLSIVRRLSGLMGGEVGVDSAAGVGSTFWIEVPMAVAAGDPERVDVGRGGLDVVVADDEPSDRIALAAIGRSLGWRITSCEGGKALVEAVLRRRSAGGMPDALLVDWQMPDLDGLAALGMLAGEMGKNQLPAALIVSAHERSMILAQDRLRLADAVLTKPVAASTVFNAVSEAVARRRGTAALVLDGTRLEGTSTRWLTGVCLLLVDDSDINLDIARRLLEAQGATVMTCQDGLQALEALGADTGRFDAVLMDVQMPRMDGIEATRRIRSELGLDRIPVLALTAGALVEERRRALDAGMSEFLTKPLDPPTLIRAVRAAIESYRGTAPRVVGSFDDSTPPDPGWPSLPGIDTARASLHLAGDLGLFRKLLRGLVAEYANLETLLAQEPADADARRTLAAQMHKLRGSAGTLGAVDLHRLAGVAEQALVGGAQVNRDMLEDMVRALRLLGSACEGWADGPLPPADHAAVVIPVDQAQREALVVKLRRREIGALDDFEAMTGAWRAELGDHGFTAITQALERLDFEAALGALEADASANDKGAKDAQPPNGDS